MRKEFRQFLTVVALVCLVALLTFGCAKPVKVEPVEPAEPMVAEPDHPPWEPEHTWPGPAEDELLTDTGERGDELAVREGRTSDPLLPVYFDFDRSHIRGDQEERITHNGEYMLDNRTVRVRVEGNTDERGTREYNMALGERRAMSAKKYLMDMGIASGRLETVSYGEERPIAFGQDEESWSLNRRVDFVILR